SSDVCSSDLQESGPRLVPAAGHDKHEVTGRPAGGTNRGDAGTAGTQARLRIGTMTASPTLYERYAPWRRWAEAGFVFLVVAGNAVANSVTTWKIGRAHV